MNIKIFGDSITNARRFTHQPFTFVDILEHHYQCKDEHPNYRGRARCSEERILYFLKKLKKIDVAVIFHGHLTHEFCPSCTDDFDHGTIDDEDLEYMVSNDVDRHFFNDVIYKIPFSADITPCKYNAVTTRNILENHRRFHYNIDLQYNRYQGALSMIDQYVTAKSIKTIHCIQEKYIPSWFKFSSGIVITEFSDYQHHPIYGCSYTESQNAITEEGNRIIADRLIGCINELLSQTNRH